MNPAKLTAEEIAAWRLTISAGQRHHVTQTLRSALRWAVGGGLIPSNPAAYVKNPTRRSREIKPFQSWEEIDAILEELETKHRPIILFAVGTGTRPGEWVAVEPSDLTLIGKRPSVNIMRRLTKDKTIEEPKDGKPRRIPLRPRVVEALKGMPTRIDSPLLFPGEKVKYMNLVAFARDHWKPALEGAGLEHRGLYSLRHTFASWLIAEGLNTFQVSRALGTGIENVDLPLRPPAQRQRRRALRSHEPLRR
jgi:integrase